ncbi:unnamed protein product [Fraxinus pennsylvanica]|uniref:Uncharacterized protein n=1 Tax=Fraxinus pennsylvanica TaxID=56036 RepID=A0AAD1YUF4_9LAMI|nr:unnamed protein product [Fraxinus pennsylvanica]
MAALKCSHVALLAFLSLVVCSAHRTLPNEAGTNHDRVVSIMEDTTHTDHAWNGHVLSNGGGGGGGGVVSNPTIGGAPIVGSAGGYGSGSGNGNNGGISSGSGGGGGGGGGGWLGGVPNFGIPGVGAPGFGVPVGGNGGGYGFGGGYGSGSGGNNGGSPPGYGEGPWVPPPNYHCQPMNCGNPFGCPGFTMHFSHHTHMNAPASNMPAESTGHAMAPADSH